MSQSLVFFPNASFAFNLTSSKAAEIAQSGAFGSPFLGIASFSRVNGSAVSIENTGDTGVHISFVPANGSATVVVPAFSTVTIDLPYGADNILFKRTEYGRLCNVAMNFGIKKSFSALDVASQESSSVVINLLSEVNTVSNGVGAYISPLRVYRSFMAFMKDNTGSATVSIDVSNDGVIWMEACTLTPSAASPDGYADALPWPYVRARVTSVSGAVSVNVCR